MSDSVNGVLLMVVLLLCAECENQDLVMTRLGVKALKLGKIALADDYTIMSLFLKLPNISDTNTPTPRENTLIQRCIGEELSEYIETRLTNETLSNDKSYFAETIENIHRNNEVRIMKFIESRNHLLQPYFWNQDTDTSGRNKRQVLALLAAGAGLAFGGLTEYQMYKIRKHLSENENEINQIRSEFYSQQSEILSIKHNLIVISRNITQTLTEYFTSLQCRNFLSIYASNLERKFSLFKETIDNVLTATVAEKSAILKPNILEPPIIEKIVRQHKELNDTWYTKHPLLLYSISELTLLDIDKNLNYAHFTLSVPLIYRRKPIYNVYRTSQVGTVIPGSNNSCRYFQISENLIETQKGEFLSIDLKPCVSNRALHVCPSFSTSLKPSCLQINNVTCTQNIRNCETAYDYKVSTQGILLRNNKDNDTFTINSTGWAALVQLNQYRVTYLPWSDLTAIQIHDTKLISPSTVYEAIPLIDESYDTPIYPNIVSTDQLTDTFNELIEETNTSLNRVLDPIFKPAQEIYNGTIWKIVLSIIQIFIILWVAYIHLKLILRYRYDVPLRYRYHPPRKSRNSSITGSVPRPSSW